VNHEEETTMTLQPWADLAPREAVHESTGGRMLNGVRCVACGRVDFPAVPLCRSCLSDQVVDHDIEPTGALYAFTTIRTAEPSATVGYVDLVDGLRVFAHLTGEVAIGDRVTLSSATLPITFSRTEDVA
jgi:uncharacterized OB-fold protein